MYKKAIASSVAIVLAVIVIVFAGLSGYLYVSNSSLQSSLNTANSQVTSLQTSVTTLNSQVSSLSSQNQILNSNITSLQQQKLALSNQITSLNQNISSLEQERTTLQNQLTTALNNASSLKSQLTTAQNNISSLQAQLNQVNSQLSSLQSQVNSLTSMLNLDNSLVELSSQSVTTGASGNVSVITFVANYPGYVAISDLSASDYANEGPAILDMFSSSIQSSYTGVYIPTYGFFNPFTRIGGTVAYPITPGTITVYLDTSDTTAQTATLTVTYYY